MSSFTAPDESIGADLKCIETSAGNMIKIEELPNDEPTGSEDPIQRLQRSSTPSAASQDDANLVNPQPGFVIKTTDETGSKVFINVCGAAEVDAVGDWADGQMPESVSKALDGLQSPLDAASKEALRFPVSVGERREDADHTGAPSYVVDAIFNSDVMQVAAHVRQLKTFIVQLLLNYVGTKHDMKLDTNYKLPRMRYKGAAGPQPQYIRAAPKQLITEVIDDRSTSAPAFALRVDKPRAARGGAGRSSPPAVASAQPKPPQMPQQRQPAAAPQQRQQQQQQQHAAAAGAQQPPPAAAAGSDMSHSLEFEGSPATAANITVQSPALWHCEAGACSIAATHDSVTICVRQQKLEVKLPFSVDVTAADALADGAQGWLRVRLPFRAYRDVLASGKIVPSEITACRYADELAC